MKVHELLTDEKKWTQNSNAKDKNNYKINPLNDNAVSWCLIGAVIKCYDKKPIDIRAKIIQKLEESIKTRLYLWNDTPGRTFNEVRELCINLDV